MKVTVIILRSRKQEFTLVFLEGTAVFKYFSNPFGVESPRLNFPPQIVVRHLLVGEQELFEVFPLLLLHCFLLLGALAELLPHLDRELIDFRGLFQHRCENVIYEALFCPSPAEQALPKTIHQPRIPLLHQPLHGQEHQAVVLPLLPAQKLKLLHVLGADSCLGENHVDFGHS